MRSKRRPSRKRASTDFGLKSQWLDMTSYDHQEDFGLYLAVLKNDTPTRCCRKATRTRASAAGAVARQHGRSARTRPPAARTPRTPVNVQIDFEGIQQRIINVQNVPERPYSLLRAGVAGTVFYMEPEPQAERDSGGRGAPEPANILHRYRLSDRRAAVFANRVATYDVSDDGHKLVYRTVVNTAGRAGEARNETPPPPPQIFLADADGKPPQSGEGHLNVQLRMYLDPKEEFKQIFYEGWRNQRDYLYVPNMHGADWPRMKEMYGQLLPYVNHRADLNYLLDMMGIGDFHRAFLRSRRRHARGAAVARRVARRGLRHRQRPL